MWRRKPAPKSDAEIIADAIKEAARQYERRERARRRRERFLWLRAMPGWLKTLLLLGLTVLAALVGDGIRRESKEFKASLVTFFGQVSVLPHGQQGWRTPEPNMMLRDKDLVRTGANSSATIIFPDGSAIQLEPNTEFEVRLLDFARGERRDRSFMVRFGAAVAYISQFFGAQSQATICTPTAVAAVRGTGFRVVYDPNTQKTFVQVAEGAVRFRTPVGEAMFQPGQMVAATGYQLQRAQGLPQPAQRALTAQVGQLRQYEHPPSLLQQVEWFLTNLLDPVLQILGLTPGGWSYAANNFARRTACKEALRRLRIHLESLDEVPNYLNPVTLQELGLNPQERDRILSAFAGNMLEGYRKVGRSDYIVRTRARDKKQTLYEMTIAEIREVRGQD